MWWSRRRQQQQRQLRLQWLVVTRIFSSAFYFLCFVYSPSLSLQLFHTVRIWCEWGLRDWVYVCVCDDRIDNVWVVCRARVCMYVNHRKAHKYQLLPNRNEQNINNLFINYIKETQSTERRRSRVRYYTTHVVIWFRCVEVDKRASTMCVCVSTCAWWEYSCIYTRVTYVSVCVCLALPLDIC